MSSTDVFATLVDVVADSLDDPETTGADLARRAYLSRFHFDRVVSAVAGESPSAFRRRVLLERAAYRLTSCRDGVLDVAVEAGYGSHEAFTRAFSRAYGLTPREWRRRPTHRFFLEAPSGVHFHPPGSLRLPARREVKGMDVLVKMVAHHVWMIGELIDRAGRLDADTLDKPIEFSVESIDERPLALRRQLDRLVWQLEMWLASVDDEPFEFPESGRAVALSQIRERYDLAGPRYVDLVRRLHDEGRFDETFVDSTCTPPRVFTYGGMVAHVLTFAAVRRTLAVGALDSAGITDLGSGDPMHYVANGAASSSMPA
jgi:AraC family transcriptional regulator